MSPIRYDVYYWHKVILWSKLVGTRGSKSETVLHGIGLYRHVPKTALNQTLYQVDEEL